MVWVMFRVYLSYDVTLICIKRYESKLHLNCAAEHPPTAYRYILVILVISSCEVRIHEGMLEGAIFDYAD